MLLWALLGAAAACALAYAGFIAAAQPAEVSDAVGLWVYHGALAFASLTCFARAALVRDQRVAWIAFGLGLLSWTAGDVYWTLAFSDARQGSVPVGRRCRLPRRPAVLLRRDRAPDQAANRPLHRRELARRGDRGARRGGDRHRRARARAGRPDEGRPGGGADEPRLSAGRHPPDRLHRRRARRQRLPGRRRVPGDRRRADRLDPRRRDLPLPGGDLRLSRRAGSTSCGWSAAC